MDIRRATVLALALMGTPALAWDDDNQDNVISNGRCPGTIYANTRLGADIIALPSDPDPCINFGANNIYSASREKVAQNIFKHMPVALGPRGIEPEQVLLRNVALPPLLTTAIQEKLRVLGDKSGLPLILSDK